MQKQAIKIALGLLLLPLTIYSGYLYMKSLNDNGNLLFLGLTTLCGGAAAYCLYRGTNPKIKDSLQVVTPIEGAGLVKQLQENNQMVDEWKETKQKRDKLQMIELGGLVASTDPDSKR